MNDASSKGSAHALTFIHGFRGELDDILKNTSGVDFAGLEKGRRLYRNYQAVSDAVLASTGSYELPTPIVYNKAFQDRATARAYTQGELDDAGELARKGGNVLGDKDALSKNNPNLVLRNAIYGFLPSLSGAALVGGGGAVAGGGLLSPAGIAGLTAAGAILAAPTAGRAVMRGAGNNLLSNPNRALPNPASFFGSAGGSGANINRENQNGNR